MAALIVAGVSLEEAHDMVLSETFQYFDSDFSEELKQIAIALNLTGEEQVVILDEDQNPEEFEELAKHFGCVDNSGFTVEDKEELVRMGWEQLPAAESEGAQATTFYKNGCVYSFAANRTEWFPAAFILIKDRLV